MVATFRYQVYGLKVASDIEIPELIRNSWSGNPNIRIRTAPVPKDLPGLSKKIQLGQFWRDGILFEHDDAGRILVTADASLYVEQWQQTAARNMRAFILGPALAAAAYAVGVVPLHMSIVRKNARNIGITGPSGAGKSTFAAFLARSRGWEIVTDDVAGIWLNGNRYDETRIWPGPPRLKLWEDALEQLSIPTKGLVRDVSRHKKYHLSLEMSEAAPSISSLSAVVDISRRSSGDSRPNLKRVESNETFGFLMNCIYRPELAAISSNRALLMQAIKKLSTLDLFELKSVKSWRELPGELDLLDDVVCDRP